MTELTKSDCPQVVNDFEDRTISEEEAKSVIFEIVSTVGKLEQNPTKDISDEMLLLLKEIRDKLNEPGTTAIAKLKGVVSTTPAFMSLGYQFEPDTENFFRKHFPTFWGWFQGKEKPKSKLKSRSPLIGMISGPPDLAKRSEEILYAEFYRTSDT